MNSALDQNQSELGVLVLSVTFQVLADGNSLLDQVVQILRDLGGKTVGLQETEESVTSDALDLRNTARITEDHADLRRSVTLLSQSANLGVDLRSGGLVPGWRSSLVWNSGGRDTLSKRSISMCCGKKGERREETHPLLCMRPMVYGFLRQQKKRTAAWLTGKPPTRFQNFDCLDRPLNTHLKLHVVI